MKTILKFLGVCGGLVLFVYLETKLIPFLVCTFDVRLEVWDISHAPLGFPGPLCVFLYIATMVIWGFVNKRNTTWMPLVIGMLTIVCQIIVGVYIVRRYGSTMEVNRYERFLTQGKHGYYGLADKWGHEVVPPYYVKVIDCGDYAQLLKEKGGEYTTFYYDEKMRQINKGKEVPPAEELISSEDPPSRTQSSYICSEDTSKSQTIVVEHHRDPIPVNVWIPCDICGGSGQCQTCGGSGVYIGAMGNSSICSISCGGSGKCWRCAGHGGHYEVQYK